MREDEFVTYNQALRMKKLGFRDKCLVYSHREDQLWMHSPHFFNGIEGRSYNSTREEEDLCDIPLQSQAQRWLRDQGLWLFAERASQPELKGKYFWKLSDRALNPIHTENFKLWNTYEAALKQGITECLNLLENGYNRS